MPKISCVMPCRDRDDLISQSIKSIIDQTFSDWELIIVDDHSTASDKTKEIVESFADKRLKYYKLEDENGKGIAAARNFGNMMASAEYIAVADSDDICLPERFTLTLKAFEKRACDLVYGDIEIWNQATKEKIERSDEYRTREFDLEYFKKYDYIPHPTVAYKRSTALDFPYNSFFRRAEDYDFMLRLAKHGYMFEFINRPLVRYRDHKKSMTHDKTLKFDYTEIVHKNYDR